MPTMWQTGCIAAINYVALFLALFALFFTPSTYFTNLVFQDIAAANGTIKNERIVSLLPVARLTNARFDKNTADINTGLLSIQEINLNLPIIYISPKRADKAQGAVDNSNAGAISRYGGNSLISDHSGQGFDVIRSLLPGTTAKVSFCEQKGTYVLKKTLTAYRKSGFVYEEEPTKEHPGGVVYTVKCETLVDDVNAPILFARSKYDYDLFMQTCIDDKSATVTCWNELE